MAIGQLLSLSSSDLVNPANWFFDLLGGQATTAGVSITDTTALSISSVFACVRNLAEDEAKLPLPIFEKMSDGSRVKQPEHPLNKILNFEANLDMTGFSMRQAVMAASILYGTGYAEIVRAGTRVTALIPLHPVRVKILAREETTGQIVYEIRDNLGRFEKNLPDREMFVVPGFSFSGIIGEMVTRYGKESLGLAIAADQFASSYFGNGINVSGILAHPGMPKPETRKIIRESIQQEHKGSSKGNRIMMTWDGMGFTPTTVDPDKAQAVESRQFQVEEVARWFRMPPAKIGHLLRTRGWNTQEIANLDYLSDTLLAWFIRWEQEISRKLIKPSEKMTLFAQHNVDSLLRTDAKTRSDISKTQLEGGVLTLDDWAKRENMPLVGGEIGKTHWMKTTLQPAEDNFGEETEQEEQAGGFPDQDPTTMRSLTIQAFRPVIYDVAFRIVSKESLAVQRNAKKHALDCESFKVWLASFCDTQKKHVVEVVGPVIRAFSNIHPIDSEGLTNQYAKKHIEEFSGGAMAAFGEGKIDEWCDIWFPGHAETIAEFISLAIMQASD